MVTTFILVGGYAGRAKDKGESLYREIVHGLPQPVRILECLFALPEAGWVDAIEKDKGAFHAILPDLQIEFKTSLGENFVEAIKAADIVYFRGGSTKLLREHLEKISGWKEALDGKTVVGSSAGAHVLSELYVSLTGSTKIERGFGLVPIKLVTHYRSNTYRNESLEKRINWDKIDQKLAAEDSNLELVALQEGEFKVIRV